MSDSKFPKNKYLIKTLLTFIIFFVEFYLYVFVRNDNILDLFVTIAAGILFVVCLTLYISHSIDKKSAKQT